MKFTHMKFAHIMVDVGAAEKYQKAIMINPDEFKENRFISPGFS